MERDKKMTTRISIHPTQEVWLNFLKKVRVIPERINGEKRYFFTVDLNIGDVDLTVYSPTVWNEEAK